MPNLITSIEGLDVLDRVGGPIAAAVRKAVRSDAAQSALAGTWLGHKLHPVLTDVPIGAWSMACLLDASAGPAGAREARRLVGIGILAAVPTAMTGANDWSLGYGPEQRLGLVHGLANAAGTTCQAMSWIARRRGRRGRGIALSALGVGFTLGAAYLGGHLTLVRGVGVDHTAFEPTVSEWTDVAAESDVREGDPLRVSAAGIPVMLVRRGPDIHGLSATCVHAGGPLDQGKLVGDDCIACPWHGSVFRLADGHAVRGPAAEAQPRWAVRVDAGRVLVRSGSAR
ncbi:Rieske (2Fe-2S) protein [Nocardia sp. NEAU-G5]|uniref:Rieske (2Fe-2S) protein n=1 Tax=Nocardia albiluteola TaxID=2842303 RepID=A0ABS6B7I4_9NOCA|nr:Rieske (2Fe-2S) protein [Nocardia albiluteola]MBU3065745.1 Rieske (2Fe-2S) protein [Nocardia albiluteola]